jgi:hypothetical protein
MMSQPYVGVMTDTVPHDIAREPAGGDMTYLADDREAIRAEVVLLLLDIDYAAGELDDGPVRHADGRLAGPEELALIRSRTPAEEDAVMSLLDAGWRSWHPRAEALVRMSAIADQAPPLARANFDAALWAYAVPRDLGGMAPGEYGEWLGSHAALTARAARAAILPDLPPGLREEANQLLPVLDPARG